MASKQQEVDVNGLHNSIPCSYKGDFERKA